MFENDNFIKPLLYRDIMGPENTPMGAAYGCGMYGAGYMGGGMYPTNLLGGMTMAPGLRQDTFQSYKLRQKKDNNFMKNTLLVLTGMVAMGLMRFKGVKNVWNKFINFFKRTPTPTPAPAPAAPTGWWQKFKGWFHRGGGTPAAGGTP